MNAKCTKWWIWVTHTIFLNRINKIPKFKVDRSSHSGDTAIYEILGSAFFSSSHSFSWFGITLNYRSLIKSDTYITSELTPDCNRSYMSRKSTCFRPAPKFWNTASHPATAPAWMPLHFDVDKWALQFSVETERISW